MAKLFAIRKEYSDLMISKRKKVEFRRSDVKIRPGEKCFIYTSAPEKKITAYFIATKKIRMPLNELWKKTKHIAGISYNKFMSYFQGCEFGTAILFGLIKELNNKPSLDLLRVKLDFRPPQSYYEIKYPLERFLYRIT